MDQTRPLAEEILPGATDQLRGLLEQHGPRSEQHGPRPEPVPATTTLALSSAIAGPLVRYVLGVAVNAFVSQVVPQLRTALDALDVDAVKRAVNGWVVRLGGTAPFPEVG